MTELAKILRESFKLLIERPKIFTPKLISALISSFLLAGFIAGWINTLQFITFTPFSAILGIFTPVMVSSMVKNKDKDMLRTGFKDACKLWKPIAGLTGLTFILAFINSIPLSIGIIATRLTGQTMYLGIGGAISLIILLAIGFGLYFIPISVIENRSFFKSIKDGFKTSKRNTKEVTILTLLSLIILGSSSLVTGRLRNIGIIVFFTGRLTSSIIGTYILVISPKYYLEEKNT